MKRARRRYLDWLVGCLLCLLLVGCGTDSNGTRPSGGPKAFGERCQKTEDCASLLCVRLDDAGGVCSQACDSAQSCPASDNWGCLPSPGGSFSVCACLPLGPTEVCGDALDNDCDGKVDDCRICNGRPVSNDDHENCGACSVACRDDQRCEGGKCQCTDAQPDQCGDGCTSLAVDAQNCGACGVTCSLGQVCRNGSCACPDAATPDFCPGIGCVSLRQDSEHCGGCGTACTLGQACADGACICPAGTPPDFCDGVGCIYLSRDVKNCGECGNACLADQECSGGACSCPSGKVLCGDECVDPKTDKANCGECDNACPAAQACVDGQCGCSAAGLSVCGEGCANLQTDATNCGACGNECAPGEICSGGACLCQSGLHCSDECMAANDDANCGGCGTTCSASQYCSAGSCTCSGFGLTKCGAECFDTRYDELHCGSCDTTCRSGESCSGGTCACQYPQQYCESAGKCVSLSSDAANCGACGQACDPTEVCTGAQCVCPTAGQEYCAAEGKCVDTQSNTLHCGSCQTACKPTEVCSYGTCDCSGYSEEFCAKANACVDLWTDNKNCGACDKVCPTKTHCSYAGCQCDTAGQTLCGGTTCFDLQTNAKNCGECGNACGGSYVCVGGNCQCPNPTVGTAVRLSNNTVSDTGPVAAWDGTHVGVAYRQQIVANGSYYNLRFALLNPNGTLFKDVALTNYVDGAYKSAGSVSGPRPDKLGVTWNGSEYAIVWDDIDHTAFVDTVRLIRVTPAGVASASVTVATNAELPGPVGPAVVWSVPYGGYLISGSISNQVYYRRVGALGTNLEVPNTFSNSYTCNSALAVAPDGRAAVSCNYAYGSIAFFEADGSRTRPVGGLGVTQVAVDSATIWDGTTFDTAVAVSGSGVRLLRDGSSLPWMDLLPYTSGVSQTSVELVAQGNSLALGSVAGAVYTLDRYNLTSDLEAVPAKIHNQVSIVSTPNVEGTPELVEAGPGKLLAIWADNRWGSASELYAAPIDLKACP